MKKRKKFDRKRLIAMVAVLGMIALLFSANQRSAYAATENGSMYVERRGAAVKLSAVSISTQPQSVSVQIGTTVTFTVAATGTAPFTYQWQYKAPGATTWTNSSAASAKTNKFKFETKVSHNGYQFRCVVKDGNGSQTTSNPATLTVRPKISTQPESKTVAVGDSVELTVSATGKATLKYQWQYQAPGATSWTNSSAASAKTAKFTFDAKVSQNGYQFRCAVTDGNGNKTNSGVATLTVTGITSQPQSKTVEVGDSVELTVAATGTTPLKYQWQYQAPGATGWSNSSAASAKTAKFAFAAKTSHHGYKFRCVVTDNAGKQVISNVATITVKPKITTQPKSSNVTVGATVTFTVAATGKATLKYQWQHKAPGATTWTNSSAASAKTAKFTFSAKISQNGYQFRCVVTDGNGKQTFSDAATVTVSQKLVNATDVTLYALSDSMKDVLTIPSGKKQSFQLVANGTNATYRVDSGSSCTVDANGLIQIRTVQTTVYNLSTGESRVEDRVQYGDSVIKCVVDGETCYVNVHVVDYSVVYADELIAQYLSENITDNMTDMEKMQAIARYPASFDYDYHYSGYVSMLVYGGGDCWASTSLIIRECEMLGIEAWSRNGNKDPGAGSGHRNAMAYYNGKYYELEAGYSGTAPRSYNVTIRTSLFSYRQLSDGTLSVYQYDAHTVGDKLVIPSTINGKTVKVIEKSFFPTFSGTEIVLPDTCEEIGDYAFSGCSNLLKVNLPANLKTLGKGTFAQAVNVKFTLSSSNTYLALKNNCVYSKDYAVLYWASAVSGKLTLPSGLQRINDYAFYYNTNITEIVVPSTVTEIGEGAFGNCSKLEKITFQGTGLTTIGPFAFAYTNALSEITLPSSVQELDQYAFYYGGTKNVILTSLQAPAWIGSDVTASNCEKITFYVPTGSIGYDTGDWSLFNVVYGTPST